ncbi:hypothetical protein CR513_45791, partial [Mucuna pruriens]
MVTTPHFQSSPLFFHFPLQYQTHPDMQTIGNLELPGIGNHRHKIIQLSSSQLTSSINKITKTHLNTKYEKRNFK